VVPAQHFYQAAASTSVILGVNLFHLLTVGKASLCNLDILGNVHSLIANSRLIRADWVRGVYMPLDEDQLSLTTSSSYDDITYTFGRIGLNIL
jgi:hypothetical protein